MRGWDEIVKVWQKSLDPCPNCQQMPTLSAWDNRASITCNCGVFQFMYCEMPDVVRVWDVRNQALEQAYEPGAMSV